MTAGDLPVVLCDASQIRQLLQNLISNALKYRDVARAPQITIGSVVENESTGNERLRRLRVSIADNGIGFDPKYVEQIFEPFQRLHGPDEYEGTGIGLAICRKIVSRHGGWITATSSARRGLGVRLHAAFTRCG